MEHDEQLAWEARASRPVAAAAFGTGLIAIGGAIYLSLAVADREEGTDGLLESMDSEAGDYLVQSIAQSVGLLLLVPVLLYLFRATRHRRPEVMPAAAVMAVLGALTLAVVTVLLQLERIDVAHDFVPFRGANAEEAAEDALADEVSPALQGFGLGGAVALAFAVVVIALNAMRAGLLSRFMGILGIFVGVLLVIPLGMPVLQLFWFAALGFLFLDRWPGGRGPAWASGEPIPWPGAAEQRAEMERRRAEEEPAAQPETEEASEPVAAKPASRKRRKKRR